MQQNNLHPDTVLEALKKNASVRGQKTLDLIHTICKEQHASGIHDYSVRTIGRVSKERGGPTEQALRNRDGERYRTLMAAWTGYTSGSTRKLPAKAERGVADDVLGLIPDARVRALVGSFLAENRKLKAENTLLKSQANIVIDRRPTQISAAPLPHAPVQVLEPLSMLLPSEVEALQHAISDELMKQMGWTPDPKTGRVKQGFATIFRAGFVKAVEKVLAAANAKS
jgi:hypothetical protein